MSGSETMFWAAIDAALAETAASFEECGVALVPLAGQSAQASAAVQRFDHLAQRLDALRAVLSAYASTSGSDARISAAATAIDALGLEDVQATFKMGRGA